MVSSRICGSPRALVGHAIAAADLDVPAFERDVFLRGRIFDLDFPAGAGGWACAGSGRVRSGRDWTSAGLVLLDQALERIELRLAAAAAHLSVGDAQDLLVTRNVVWQLGTLGQHLTGQCA